MNARRVFDAVSWHTRGVFAVAPIRELGFAARGLLQLPELRARQALARELLADRPPAVHIDRQRGYVKLATAVTPTAVPEMCAIGSDVAGSNAGKKFGNKDFFRARFSKDAQLEVLLSVALDRDLLASIAEYLGTMPVLCEADFYCSIPTPPPYTKSQLWHCDDDGASIVKLFVYCEDVTAANGPFEFIDASTSAAARRAVGYRYAGRRYRVSDATMDRHVPRPSQLAIEGPRTTGFLIDTAHCFHRGSRILDANQRRVAVIATYCRVNAKRLPLRLRHNTAPLARFLPRFADRFSRAVLGEPVARTEHDR